jgi:hypothetical protein
MVYDVLNDAAEFDELTFMQFVRGFTKATLGTWRGRKSAP